MTSKHHLLLNTVGHLSTVYQFDMTDCTRIYKKKNNQKKPHPFKWWRKLSISLQALKIVQLSRPKMFFSLMLIFLCGYFSFSKPLFLAVQEAGTLV